MQGRSGVEDARAAVEEATAAFDRQPEIVFVMSSTRQDPVALHAAFAERFPNTPIVGCTTAGELLGTEHSTGQIVAMGVVDSGFTWGVRALRGLSELTADTVQDAVGSAFEEVGIDPDEVAEDSAVCLLFVDGLRGQEERVSELLAEALAGVPLAGGSAGDDLKFEQCHVYGPDGAVSDAATIIIAHSKDGAPVRVLKHQHFKSTPKSVAVTRAEGRRVYEFDGYPAAIGYAAALGMTPEELTSEVTFMHPVTFACNGQLYVRSIQAVHDDGSIDFYCAVEEGTVLDIGGHDDMASALANDLDAGFADRPQFVVGFNCILRALEATQREIHDELGAVYGKRCPDLIAFDTYGEQLNGLHINQTLVAVGFGAAE